MLSSHCLYIWCQFGTIYRVNFRGLRTRFGTTPITLPFKFISAEKSDKKVCQIAAKFRSPKSEKHNTFDHGNIRFFGHAPADM